MVLAFTWRGELANARHSAETLALRVFPKSEVMVMKLPFNSSTILNQFARKEVVPIRNKRGGGGIKL